MFGFILPNLSSLEEVERRRYKAVYCGVCRSIRARYGQLPRLAVSYDMTFLALVLGSLYEPTEVHCEKRCPAHPFEQQEIAQSEFTDYAADLSVALAYHKLLDDWRDDHSTRSRAAAAALAPAYRRAKGLIPAQCAAIEEAMDEIHTLEEASAKTSPGAPSPDSLSPDPPSLDSSSPDAVANRFGLLLGQLFACKDDFWATELRRFGARLGKFVYVMDAAMDLEEDLKTGSYNPFAVAGTTHAEIREDLELLAAAMADSFERLPLERDVHVLRSVLYAGVWQRYLAKENKENHG